MALGCYVDESGTHDPTGRQPGSEVAVMAACLADKEVWVDFEKPWEAVLDAYGVDALHTSELLAQRRNPKPKVRYYGWSEKKGDAFVDDLSKVISDFPIYKIARSLHVHAYDEWFPKELKDHKDYRHPWMFCFWNLMSDFLDIEKTTFPDLLQPGEKIAFMFDRQKEFGPDALALFQRFQTLVNWDGLFGSMGFVDKKDCPQVQVADLVAYRVRVLETKAKREGKGHIELEAGTSDCLLFGDGKANHRFYDAESIMRIAPKMIWTLFGPRA